MKYSEMVGSSVARVAMMSAWLGGAAACSSSPPPSSPSRRPVDDVVVPRVPPSSLADASSSAGSKPCPPSTFHLVLDGKPAASGESAAPIVEKIAMPAGAPVDRDSLDRDVLLIEGGLQDRGYLDARVDAPRLAAPPPGTCAPGKEPSVDVTFPVHEGIRYRVGKLTVRELDTHDHPVAPLGGQPLRPRFFSQADGAWLDRAALVTDIRSLRDLYGAAGYGDVEADPVTQIDVASRTIDVDIAVRRGPAITLDHVVFVGNHAVPSAALLKVAGLRAGERWNTEKIDAAKERLAALAALESVAQTADHVPTATRWTVTFEVKEKAP